MVDPDTTPRWAAFLIGLKDELLEDVLVDNQVVVDVALVLPVSSRGSGESDGVAMEVSEIHSTGEDKKMKTEVLQNTKCTYVKYNL